MAAARLAGLGAAAAALEEKAAAAAAVVVVVANFAEIAVEFVFFVFVFRAGAGAFLARVVAGG